MLVDQKVDAFNASFASWRAVGENWRAMSLWALIITVLCAIGVATYFAGLVVIVPWLGYASWHAYRDTLVPRRHRFDSSEKGAQLRWASGKCSGG